jgi:hypothetical protein
MGNAQCRQSACASAFERYGQGMTTKNKNNTSQLELQSVRILVVGKKPERLVPKLTDAFPNIAWHYASTVSDAFSLAHFGDFACAVVDASDDRAETALLLARLAEHSSIKNLVVIAPSSVAKRSAELHSNHHLVDTAQQAEEELLSVLQATPEVKATGTEQAESKKKGVQTLQSSWQNFAKVRAITVLSSLYKTFAIVFLMSLLAAFLFYGVLICFHLISTSWAAPTTLSNGHELVTKVEQKLAELQLRQNLQKQQLVTAGQQALEARRERQDAEMLVQLIRRTIDVEISHRRKLKGEIDALISRLANVQSAMAVATRNSGIDDELAQVFNHRLIDRQTYNTGVLALLETGHRLAMIENEIATQRLEAEKISTSMGMLRWLSEHARNGSNHPVAPGGHELIPLASQLFKAKASLANAETKLNELSERRKILEDSWIIATKSIKTLRDTPLGRAINTPVVVLFVPYSNSSQFQPGKTLHACLLTVILCETVGTVGVAVSGEVRAVHPFFGKPVRGYFVNVHLKSPDAAKRELLHVGRAPFFL